jgi:uncharacterized membrane protein
MFLSYLVWPLHLFIAIPLLQYLLNDSSYNYHLAKKQTLGIILILITIHLYGLIAGFKSLTSVVLIVLLSIVANLVKREGIMAIFKPVFLLSIDGVGVMVIIVYHVLKQNAFI